MLFFSPYRYRGQLYSIIYGQAIPSVIGQKSVALTLLLTPDSSKTNAVEEQAVESTIEQDANDRIEDEQETKEDNEVYTDDKERESEIDKKMLI